MYDFVDQSAARLTEGSRFILWAMREWSSASRGGICPPKVLAPAFLRIEAGEILGDFHTLMVYVHRHGGEQLVFRSTDESIISETEAVLLALWREVTAGRREQVRRLVPHLVCETVASATSGAVERAAARLSALGLAPSGLRLAEGSTGGRLEMPPARSR